jgi:alpha-beta hydrolase superfamily lysophospholipase
MTEHPPHDYAGPSTLSTRGTVLVVPGRGETAHTYRRFGARLAADSYRVRILAAPDLDPDDVESSLDRLAGQLTEALRDLESVGQLVRPLVLVGSDTGAVALGALVGRWSGGPAQPPIGWWPQGVVLAALPGYGTPAGQAGDWDDELDARTRCPAHRAVLTGDAAVRRGALNVAVPAPLLDAAYGSTADLPHLLLAGEGDDYADREALTRITKALPRARLALVRGAHHDVLNDLPHRSVAAEVVTFLEVLRDAPLVPIVSVESSAW